MQKCLWSSEMTNVPAIITLREKWGLKPIKRGIDLKINAVRGKCFTPLEEGRRSSLKLRLPVGDFAKLPEVEGFHLFPVSEALERVTCFYRSSEGLDLGVPSLSIPGGHVASGTRFRTTEDPAGDRRLDAGGSGSAAET